jgi:hypothetical protein
LGGVLAITNMVAEVPVRLLHNTRTQAALVASGAVVGYARLESLASSVKILLKTLLQSA